MFLCLLLYLLAFAPTILNLDSPLLSKIYFFMTATTIEYNTNSAAGNNSRLMSITQARSVYVDSLKFRYNSASLNYHSTGDNSYTVLYNSVVSDNTGSVTPIQLKGATIQVLNSTFTNNKLTQMTSRGGGALMLDCVVTTACTFTMVNNTFQQNSINSASNPTLTGGAGAAMAVFSTTNNIVFVLNDTSFTNNVLNSTCTVSTSTINPIIPCGGGAIFFGELKSLNVSNCYFGFNSAPYSGGGAMVLYGAVATKATFDMLGGAYMRVRICVLWCVSA